MTGRLRVGRSKMLPLLPLQMLPAAEGEAAEPAGGVPRALRTLLVSSCCRCSAVLLKLGATPSPSAVPEGVLPPLPGRGPTHRARVSPVNTRLGGPLLGVIRDIMGLGLSIWFISAVLRRSPWSLLLRRPPLRSAAFTTGLLLALLLPPVPPSLLTPSITSRSRSSTNTGGPL